MAKELSFTYTGSNTVYAIVRNEDDGKVWDNVASAWDTWVDGDIGDYDVTMTSQGGDYYLGDMPTGIANGVDTRVFYYDRAGGQPAITDLLLSTQLLTKTALSATPTAPASDQMSLTTARDVVLETLFQTTGSATYTEKRVDIAIMGALRWANQYCGLLRKKATKATVASTETIDFQSAATDFYPTNLLSMRISSGGTTSYDELYLSSCEDVYRRHRADTGSRQPEVICFETKTDGIMHPTPDAVYTITFLYKDDISAFTAGTSDPGNVGFDIPINIIYPILQLGATVLLQTNDLEKAFRSTRWREFKTFCENIKGYESNQGMNFVTPDD